MTTNPLNGERTRSIERRFLPNAKHGVRLVKRADAAADSIPEIAGVAAVYYNADDPAGTQYQLWDNVFERILPGAFDKAVGRDDVRALQNHDPRLLLGRTASKTLELKATADGLEYVIQPPNTTAGRDTVESLARGDIDGSSFAFSIDAGGVEWTRETVEVNGNTISLDIRNIKAVKLYDVGPVTYPAYSGTSSGTRSPGVFLIDARSDGSAEMRAIQDEHAEFRAKLENPTAAASRLRRCRLAELA